MPPFPLEEQAALSGTGIGLLLKLEFGECVRHWMGMAGLTLCSCPRLQVGAWMRPQEHPQLWEAVNAPQPARGARERERGDPTKTRITILLGF